MVKKKVLVVDDEPDLIKLLKKRLESGGHEVMVAADGKEALEAVQREIPDLILLDILLPQMSGYQVLHKLRELGGKIAEVPVIIITARGRMKDLFKDEKISGFIAKPFEAEELLLKVDEALPKTEAEKYAGKKALVIGDDQFAVKPIKDLLLLKGWEVLSSLSGPEGIEKAVKDRPDVIIAQAIMEGMNGLEACLFLKRMPGTAKMSSLVFSTQDLSYEEESPSKKITVIKYISKNDLTEKVGKYLEDYIKARK